MLESDGSYVALQIATETSDRYLYVEYRSALGGALLTWSDSDNDMGGTGTYGNTMLVDGTPETFSITDAALSAGSYIMVDLGSSSSDSGERMCAIHVESDANTGRLSVEVIASDTTGPTMTPAPTSPEPSMSPTVGSERCGDVSLCCEEIAYSGEAYYKVSDADDSDDSCCTEHCTYVSGDKDLYIHYVAYWDKYYLSNPGFHCFTEGSLTYWAELDADFVSEQCTQTAAPSSSETSCEDSTSWFKTGAPSKSCAWVASNPDNRCAVKDENAFSAYEQCHAACGNCGVACLDSSSWYTLLARAASGRFL